MLLGRLHALRKCLGKMPTHVGLSVRLEALGKDQYIFCGVLTTGANPMTFATALPDGVS